MQYVIGEIFVGLGIAALAGLLVGWFLKGSFRTGTKSARTSIPESIDSDATLDMTMALADKDVEVEKLTLELHQLRGRDVTLQAGHSNQVQEINQLREDLTRAREALEANRAEFSSFRTAKKAELEQAAHQISAFKSGSPAQDERMEEARETISALRVAVRENDRIIETLRARVREGDNTVEDLRNQLHTAERGNSNSSQLLAEREQQFSSLKIQLAQTSEKLGLLEVESQTAKEARSQEVALNRNNEKNLAALNARLQDASKQLTEKQNIISRLEKQIAESTARIDNLQAVTGKFDATEKALRKETRQRDVEISMLDGQLKTATEQLDKAKAELTNAGELRKMHKDKSAEVVAMHDMLSAAGKKREALESELGKMKRLAAEHSNALAKIKEHEQTNAKLRADLDSATASRENLSTQLVELQQANTLKDDEHKRKIQALKKASDDRVNTESATLNQKTQRALVERNADLAKLQEEFKTVVAKRDDYEQQINTLQRRFVELDTDTQKRIDTIQTELNQAQQDARSKLQQANEKRAALEKQLAQLQNVANTHEANVKTLSKDKQQAAKDQQRIVELEALINQADERARKQAQTIELRNREIAQAKSRIGQLSALERQLADSQRAHQQEVSARSQFGTRINDINEKRDRAEVELAASSAKVQQLAATVKQLQPLEQQVSRQSTELASYKRDIADKASTLKQMEAQLQQSVAQSQAHEKRIVALQKDLATQTELASRVAGLERSLSAATQQTEQSSAVFSKQQEAAQNNLVKLQSKISEQTEQLTASEAKVKRLSNQLLEADRTKLELADSKSTILRLQSSVSELSAGISTKEELETERARATELAAQLAQRDQNLSASTEKAAELNNTIDGYKSRLRELEAELQQQRDLAKSAGDQSETTLALNKKLADQSGEIEALREQLFEAQNAQSDSRTDAALQAQNNAKLQRSLNASENELARLTTRVNELEASKSAADTVQYDAADDRSQELTARLNSMKVQLAEKDHNINQLQNRIAQIQVDSTQNASIAGITTGAADQKLQGKFDAVLAEAEQWRQRALRAEQTSNQQTELRQSLESADRQAQAYQGDLQRTREQLQQLQSRNEELQQHIDRSASVSKEASPVTNRVTTTDTRPVNPRRAKPRVFARQSDNFLRDSIGYGLHSAGEGDDLTLLPGVDQRVEALLNQAGITEFQQIALWSKREISHYAEKVGLNPDNEDNHEWPTVARQILDGSLSGETENS